MDWICSPSRRRKLMFIVSEELLDRSLWLEWLLAISILSPKLLNFKEGL